MNIHPPARSNLSRREFCAVSAGAVASVAGASIAERRTSEPSRLEARPAPPTESIAPGIHRLEFGSERDGFLYVPPSYRANVASPMLVLLHGAGQSSTEWSRLPLDTLLGAHNVVAIVPDSRDATWDLGMGGFGPDVRFIDRALRYTYARCNIDSKRVGLMGFSDGASYSLSLGITNGDLFSGLIALSPGYMSPATQRAKPPIFVAHGTEDRILPINAASRRMVPALLRGGYDVTYVEFDGPHRIMVPIVAEATEWFMSGKKPANAKPT
jgi:phospholipase/carboxylesterase